MGDRLLKKAENKGNPNQLSGTVLSLIRGAELSFANAEQLYEEAILLRKNGALCRAYFLHQISLEECAKIDILGAWAFSADKKDAVDFQKLKSIISSHEKKNRTNAYNLKRTESEKSAKTYREAIEAFKRIQDEFHRRSNEAKNSSLYVDIKDGNFISPTEAITDEMVTEISSANEEFLGLMSAMVRTLQNLQADPKKYMDRFKGLEKGLRALKDSHNDNPSSLEKLLNEFLDEELDKIRAQKKS